MKVADVMTRGPSTVDARATVRQAIDELLRIDARHLPVVDGGRFLGLLAERDFRPVLLPADAHDGGPAHPLLARPVSELLVREPIHVNPETDLAGVVGLMVDHQVDAIAVCDAGSRRLVGILSYVDVLRALRDVLARPQRPRQP